MMKYRIFKPAIISVSFLLFACGMKIPAQEIVSMSDTVLCETYYNQQLTPETNQRMMQEIEQRKIECHPHHRQCIAFGHKKGSKDYANCRMELEKLASQERQIQEQINSEERQLDKFMLDLQNMKRSNQTQQNNRRW